VEHSLFGAMQKLIAIRKEIPAFADFKTADSLPLANESSARHWWPLQTPQRSSDLVVVIAIFDSSRPWDRPGDPSRPWP